MIDLRGCSGCFLHLTLLLFSATCIVHCIQTNDVRERCMYCIFVSCWSRCTLYAFYVRSRLVNHLWPLNVVLIGLGNVTTSVVSSGTHMFLFVWSSFYCDVWAYGCSFRLSSIQTPTFQLRVCKKCDQYDCVVSRDGYRAYGTWASYVTRRITQSSIEW